MNKYWLVQNLLYNCRHVCCASWWRQMFINKKQIVATCEATSEDAARKKFKLMGYDAGFLGQLI